MVLKRLYLKSNRPAAEVKSVPDECASPTRPRFVCRVKGSWNRAQAVEGAASGVPPLHSFPSADLTPPLRPGRPNQVARSTGTSSTQSRGFRWVRAGRSGGPAAESDRCATIVDRPRCRHGGAKSRLAGWRNRRKELCSNALRRHEAGFSAGIRPDRVRIPQKMTRPDWLGQLSGVCGRIG